MGNSFLKSMFFILVILFTLVSLDFWAEDVKSKSKKLIHSNQNNINTNDLTNFYKISYIIKICNRKNFQKKAETDSCIKDMILEFSDYNNL